MRKLIMLLAGLAFGPVAAFGASGSQTIANETGLTYSNTYSQNLNAYGVPQNAASKISAQVTWSSYTVANQTFSDGQQSTGSITVVSADILRKFATNKITVPTNVLGSPATAQITISSAVPGSTIFVNGNTLIEGVQWNAGATTTTAAKSLAAAINTYVGALISTNVANVVYATATAVGNGGNAFTITSSSVPAYSTTTFSGGTNPPLLGQSITFNGDKQYEGYLWTDNSGTSTGTAASIAAWLNSYGVIKATATGSVVFATATVASAAGNAFDLSASTTNLIVNSATFAGGQDAGSVTINGATFVAGVSFTTGTTTQTATSLASAINSSSNTNNVVAGASGNIVTTTSTIDGASANFAMKSSTDAALTLSGPKTVTSGASVGVMTGGKDLAWSTTTGIINIPAHGLTKAMPVLLSTGSATIRPLVNQTTYYVIVVDANNVQLATTSALAQAGTFVALTSSGTQTSGHTLTLAPLAWSQGSAGATWQVSNDGTNWVTYSTTASGQSVVGQTFNAVNPSSTTVQDFGPIDYGYLRYNVTGPTQGALQLKVILNAKD